MYPNDGCTGDAHFSATGNASWFSKNVGIGTTGPPDLLSVNPLQSIGAGSAYQRGHTVTGVGTNWTSSLVGSQFSLSNGNGGFSTSETITAYGGPTSLTVSSSDNQGSSGYAISYTGLNVTNTGTVGIGTTTPGTTDPNAKLEVNGGDIVLTYNATVPYPPYGIVFADGSTQYTAFNPANCGADFAESVGVGSDRAKYEPGDLMVIDPDKPGSFLKSNQPYSTLVAGVYSTKPGFVGRKHPAADPASADEVPMAMVGRVPTKVSTENGPIKAGDLLVASSTPGYAMKGTDHDRMLGAVIGKALGPLDSGTGVIEVLVTLQ